MRIKGENNMKVAVCICGGTIFSHIEDDSRIVLNSDASNVRKLLSAYTRDIKTVRIPVDVYSSEYATPNNYRQVFRAIVEYVTNEKVDGVLILHGTDSMACFAQLAVRCLSFLKLPIVITGSKLTPDSKNSDAAANIDTALSILKRAESTDSTPFFVVYSNSVTKKTVALSAQNVIDADIHGDYGVFETKAIDFTSREYEIRARAFMKRAPGSADRVLVIPNTPGFPYGSIVCDGYRSILIHSYHSGTANSSKGKDGLYELIHKAKENGIRCFCAPIPVKQNAYESEVILRELGVLPIVGMPIEGAWAESVL